MKRLIIRPGAIGDCLVSLPALEHLKTDYTEVWVSSQNVPLIRFADRVRSIGSTGLDLVGFDGQAEHVLTQLARFDSVVSWYGTFRQEFRSAVAHLPFVFHPALPGVAGVHSEVHAVDFYSRQVGLPDGMVPHLPVARIRNPLAIFHPFSSHRRKNWELAKFRQLAARFPLPVEWTAGPEEDLPDARRFDDLFQLAQWIASASVYVGNDSGISHLAAAAGVPVVVIFRATDPAIWAPRGPRVSALRGDPEVDEVLQAAVELWKADAD